MDSATPGLFLEACCGRGKTVEIHLTKTGPGAGADVFMAYTLRNAVISSYATKAKSRQNERPWEKLTISFTDIETKYTPYSDKAVALAPIVKGFDASRNQKR
ncbi:MAG: type VI secretion system tube protein Hcp [Ectothiorhodospiraceae bacterium]|nr:type VI secretion system tube protein Hcp [Ectothiorhodospiraceae bacterium]